MDGRGDQYILLIVLRNLPLSPNLSDVCFVVYSGGHGSSDSIMYTQPNPNANQTHQIQSVSGEESKGRCCSSTFVFHSGVSLAVMCRCYADVDVCVCMRWRVGGRGSRKEGREWELADNYRRYKYIYRHRVGLGSWNEELMTLDG